MTQNLAAEPVQEVTDLHKHFILHNVDGRRVDALHGINLLVHEGEHVALAGSSGAGKSTLLRCIYRTYLPSKGMVRLRLSHGTRCELTGLSDAAMAGIRGRELGYVSQFLRAEPRRGPLDIVARAGMARGMERTEARDAAATALQRLHIDEALWDVYATVLSGGEKQRVNLAAGIISPPRLLLLDEPVSALDPANREAALELISELTSQGVGVLAVFHDLDAMHRLATRVVLMADGQITEQGHPDHILSLLSGVSR